MVATEGKTKAMNENVSRQGWHLERSVSISHIISTLILAGAVASWAMAADTRIEVNKSEIGHSEQRLERVEQRLSGSYKQILEELKDLRARIDRLNDAQSRTRGARPAPWSDERSNP